MHAVYVHTWATEHERMCFLCQDLLIEKHTNHVLNPILAQQSLAGLCMALQYALQSMTICIPANHVPLCGVKAYLTSLEPLKNCITSVVFYIQLQEHQHHWINFPTYTRTCLISEVCGHCINSLHKHFQGSSELN